MSLFKKYIFALFVLATLNNNAQEYKLKSITKEDGLPSNTIYDIQQDKIGYLWIATEKGLVKYDGDDFTIIHNKKTTKIFIDDETIYSGIENGLFIKNNSKETFVQSKKVTQIFRYNQVLYAGTIEGIYRLKNDKLLPLKLKREVDFSIITDVKQTDKGLLISSSSGLYKINNLLNISNLKKIKNGYFTSIEKSYNGFIAANLNGEVFEIKKDSIIKITNTLDYITSVKKIKNDLWFTSKNNGIEIFTLPSFSFKRKINKYNSLKTNTINTVFKDFDNTIFIASNKGIFLFKNNNYQKSENTKPKVYFENVQINHQNLDTLLSAKNIKLPHFKNNIAISFKTVSISNPKKVQYRYQLNNKYSNWSTNNAVQFPNLNAGKYAFKVQSKLNNQESLEKSFSFTIDAPFYKKAWFIFTVVISLLLIGYIFLDFYIRKINNKNEKKINKLRLQNRLLSLEQKALQLQMNPHFIFNVLNGIKALGNKGDKKELNETISKFSILLRGILNNSRKEEITLKDEITLLKNYIELEQRMSSKSFTYSIKTELNNIDEEEILIPTMLIQPFIENSIQHAFNTNFTGDIKVQFKVKYKFLHCTVIDNGIGIKQSQIIKGNNSHKSVALKVSKERLIAIHPNSRLKIDEVVNDSITKGTKVTFRIPLKTDF